MTNEDDRKSPASGLDSPAASAGLSPRLIHQDPERAREILDALPLSERARELMRLSGRDRLLLVELSAESEALVQSLPAPELWLTIKEIGEEDAIELVRMATPEQVQHMMDLECWRRDLLDPAAVAYWLMLINHAGPEAMVNWFNQADEEFLVASLSGFFRVFRNDPDDQGMEPWRELDPIWTLDDAYYLHFPEPLYAPVIQQMFRAIADAEPMKYYGLLDMVDHLPATEEEEKAYRFRMARLADYGFADMDESLEIYAPLSERELTDLLARAPAPTERWIGAAEEPWKDPLARAELPELLNQALSRIEDPDVLSDIQIGIATLQNRILIADDSDLTQVAAVVAALTKAHTFLELGLRRWAGADPDKAAHVLRTQHPFLIFRAGFTGLLELGRAAHGLIKQGWPGQVRPGLELMGDDGKILQGLVKARPRFYAGADSEGAPIFLEFRTENDLARARAALYRAEILGRIFLEGLDVTERDLMLLKEHFAGPDLTWEVALTTALAHELNGAGLRFAPLTRAEAQSALETLLTPDHPRRVREEMRQQLARRLDQILSRLAVIGDADLAEARRLLADCLNELETEARDLDLADLDPRYLKTLVIIPKTK